MSFTQKNWIVRNSNTSLSPFMRVCENRGLTSSDKIEAFIEMSAEEHFFDPLLLQDMQKSIDRINDAIKKKERIMVYGDYDVDGISSTAIVYMGLNNLGANVSFRLPHRIHDGYGLNTRFIDECADLDVSLIITVDCGIANVKEIEYANNKGIQVIITDHHTVQSAIPPAYSIINPKQKNCQYPFKEICGALIAYKLIVAIYKENIPTKDVETFLNLLLELAAIATVADCCPLISENRLVVKEGLKNLSKTKNDGIKSLLKVAGAENSSIDTFTIGFLLAPRLNAAGRIRSPYEAIDILLGKTEKAKKLETLNKERQNMVHEAMEEVEMMLEKDQKILIAKSNSWHVGVVGLIAGRLVEKYYRPSIIMQEKGDYYVGSARSIENFDIMSALSEVKDLFDHFGGHKQAAGFSLPKENYKAFKAEMEKIVEIKIKEEHLVPSLYIDCELCNKDISFDFFHQLQTLAPFGIKNERPVFMLNDIQIENVRLIGSNNNHIKASIIHKNSSIDIIGFHFGDAFDELSNTNNKDIVFELDVNSWRGKESLQLKLIDFRTSN